MMRVLPQQTLGVWLKVWSPAVLQALEGHTEVHMAYIRGIRGTWMAYIRGIRGTWIAYIRGIRGTWMAYIRGKLLLPQYG